MRRICSALVLVLGAACTSGTPSSDSATRGTPSPSPPPDPDAIAVATPPPPEPEPTPEPSPEPEPNPESQVPQETLLARVDIDDAPSHKRFQGVWLVTDDGERHVIDYRARAWWLPFEGRRVEARGAHYSPFGQAISAPHFRIALMTVVKPTVDDALVSITGEQTLEGTLEEVDGPKGAKLEGTKSLHFTTAERSYPLYQRPDPLPELGKPLTVKARIVELSPFAAHIGGGHLWIDSIE